MLTVENASLHYGAAQALRGVSLQVKPKSITCVLGRNGVGKTSMLRAIVGQHPLSSGSISFEGSLWERNHPMIVLAPALLSFRRGARFSRC